MTEIDGITYTLINGTYKVTSADCPNISSVTIQSSINGTSVTGFETTGTEGPFTECENLTSIIIPSTITSLNSKEFSGCTGLTSVSFSPSITILNDSVFSGSGLKNVNFPYIVEGNNSCFFVCSDLISLSLPKITSIGGNFCKGCSKLEILYLPKIENIGQFSVRGCSSLKTFVMYENVSTIANDAFNSCLDLEYIVWKNQSALTTIGTDIFKNITKPMRVRYENISSAEELSEISIELQSQYPPGTTYYFGLPPSPPKPPSPPSPVPSLSTISSCSVLQLSNMSMLKRYAHGLKKNECASSSNVQTCVAFNLCGCGSTSCAKTTSDISYMSPQN